MTASVDYLLIGHIAADIVPHGYALGGTVSYAARTAHSFGLRVGVVTSAAPDEPLLDELRQYAQIVSIPAAQSTTFENIYTPDGRTQYMRGMAAPMGLTDVPSAWLASPLIHLAPISDDSSYDIIPHLPAEASILMTPQGWMRRRADDDRVLFKQWFDTDKLKHVDTVVFSEEDITAAPQLEAAFANAVPCCIVTRSYHGGTYHVNAIPRQYSAVPADAVDPTGAGDVFASSFASARHRIGSIDQAVRVAAILAARSITRPGLEGTPTPDEVSEALSLVLSNEDV